MPGIYVKRSSMPAPVKNFDSNSYCNLENVATIKKITSSQGKCLFQTSSNYSLCFKPEEQNNRKILFNDDGIITSIHQGMHTKDETNIENNNEYKKMAYAYLKGFWFSNGKIFMDMDNYGVITNSFSANIPDKSFWPAYDPKHPEVSLYSVPMQLNTNWQYIFKDNVFPAFGITRNSNIQTKNHEKNQCKFELDYGGSTYDKCHSQYKEIIFFVDSNLNTRVKVKIVNIPNTTDFSNIQLVSNSGIDWTLGKQYKFTALIQAAGGAGSFNDGGNQGSGGSSGAAALIHFCVADATESNPFIILLGSPGINANNNQTNNRANGADAGNCFIIAPYHDNAKNREYYKIYGGQGGSYDGTHFTPNSINYYNNDITKKYYSIRALRSCVSVQGMHHEMLNEKTQIKNPGLKILPELYNVKYSYLSEFMDYWNLNHTAESNLTSLFGLTNAESPSVAGDFNYATGAPSLFSTGCYENDSGNEDNDPHFGNGGGGRSGSWSGGIAGSGGMSLCVVWG